MSIALVMPSNHLILCCHLLLLPSSWRLELRLGPRNNSVRLVSVSVTCSVSAAVGDGIEFSNMSLCFPVTLAPGFNWPHSGSSVPQSSVGRFFLLEWLLIEQVDIQRLTSDSWEAFRWRNLHRDNCQLRQAILISQMFEPGNPQEHC